MILLLNEYYWFALSLSLSLFIFSGEEGEVEIEGQELPKWAHALDGHNFVDCPEGSTEATCPTVGGWQAGISAALEPILLEFGVDVYNAGHVHDYESTWPMAHGKIVQKNMTNPKAPIHITEGNGGVPGVTSKSSITPINCGGASSFLFHSIV